MANTPALTALFGTNVVQDATTITIQKSDLIDPDGEYTFTPLATNTSEQVAAALLLRWRKRNDTSADSRFRIAGFSATLTSVGSDNFIQYQGTIQILTNFNNILPSPDDIGID